MFRLIENIINDLKNNSKYFIGFLAIFLSVFYAERQITDKNQFKYRSEIIFTHPSTTSQFVNFNNNLYRQDLYHFLIKSDTKEKINGICNISYSSQIIEMDFKKFWFYIYKIIFLHNDIGKNFCLNNIFNKVILTYFEDYLSNIINNNKMMLKDYLKKKQS